MAERADTRLGYRSLRILSNIEVAVFPRRPVEHVTCSPIDYPEWWEMRMHFTDHLEGTPRIEGYDE